VVHSDGVASPASLLIRICDASARSLPVAGSAVSVMTEGGHRGVACATDATARALEEIQFTAGEGPGCDAFAFGRPVLVPDLNASRAPQWAAFGDVAAELRVRAVFAFPLRLGAASLGALTMYGVNVATLEGEDLARAVRLADAAAFAVLDLIVGVVAREADLAGIDGSGTRELLRAEIYQAAGMVMVQLGVTIEVAMVRVRSHAFASGRPIADVAREIVRRTLRLEADNEDVADQE
jgi:GAF domain